MSEPRLYDTKEAAALLGVPARAIADWKTHERVTPRDVMPGRGRGGVVPLYNLEDLRPLAEAYLERKQRTTRRTGA